MPTGSSDEGIFGSPDLSEFCCSAEVASTKLMPTSNQDQTNIERANNQPWPMSENCVGHGRPGNNSGTRKGSQSSTATSEPTESGDDEDILGLISSSLDRFNAQLHHNSQNTLSIPLSPFGDQSEIPVQDVGPDVSSSFSNSLMHTWAPFVNTNAGSTTFQQQQQQKSSLSGGYSSLASNSPVGLFCNSPLQKSIPSPPGLPRLSQQQQQPTNGLDGLPTRKQRSISQTFSDTEEASSIWDPRWKALPSEMGMLSVDSGIDGGEPYLLPSWFTNTNAKATASSESSCSTSAGCCNNSGGVNDCCGAFSLTGNYSPDMEAFPPNSQSLGAPPSQTFDFAFDASVLKHAAVLAAAAAAAAADASKRTAPPPSDLGGAQLQNLLWPPPSWPGTADCSPSTETPQMHFRPVGDNHQAQLALTSRFEADIRQRSRQLFNRRKAESICFSSAARHNSGLLSSSSNVANGMKSHSMAVNIGQLGSPPPPVDFCSQMSKSYANTPQKYSRDHQQSQRMSGSFGKSSTSGVLGAPKMGGSRNVGRSKRSEATASFSSSSSTSSSENSSDKPVIAKWRRACSFYLRGHCKKEDCEFAHDLTKVTCKFWEVGECFKGPTCPFLHGYPPELLLEVQQQKQQQQQQPQAQEQNQPLQQQVEQLAGN